MIGPAVIKADWISVSDQEPPISVSGKIRHLKLSKITDGIIDWETTGWRNSSGSFNLKIKNLEVYTKFEICGESPTHWKP